MRFTNLVLQSHRRCSRNHRRLRSRNCSSFFRYTVARAISVAVILSLMASSTPAAAPATIVALAKEYSVSLAFWFHASGLAKLIQGHAAGSANPQEKQSDRDAKVSRVQIFPGDVTVDLSDHVAFSAVAYDRDNGPVGGVKIKWSGQSSEPGRGVRLSQQGEFEATTPGSFSIAAEGAGKTAQVKVVVRPGPRRDLSLTPTSVRQVSTRDLPSQGAAGNAYKAGNSVMTPMLVEGGRWGDDNYWSADDPENSVGDPPGAPLDGGAGSSNFQFAAPIYGAPGRGITVSLAAAYNSRLWNKADSQVSFDNDRGWPAPGFSLGFGKLLAMGVYSGALLVDADGTRHGYDGSVSVYPSWGTTFTGHTIDGSMIDYSYQSGIGGSIVWAQAKLPNGTVIQYSAQGPAAVYPTSIEEPNGNYITITYVNNTGPRIQTISDTLGRVISFYYDSNNLLTAIKIGRAHV